MEQSYVFCLQSKQTHFHARSRVLLLNCPNVFFTARLRIEGHGNKLGPVHTRLKLKSHRPKILRLIIVTLFGRRPMIATVDAKLKSTWSQFDYSDQGCQLYLKI